MSFFPEVTNIQIIKIFNGDEARYINELALNQLIDEIL